MEQQFQLPVEFKGEEIIFNSKLIVAGYTHKFAVDLNGQQILFEPDEERNYRAVIPYEDINENKNIDKDLLKAIATTIKEIVT